MDASWYVSECRSHMKVDHSACRPEHERTIPTRCTRPSGGHLMPKRRFYLVLATCQSQTHHVVDNNMGGLEGAVVDCQQLFENMLSRMDEVK